MVQYKKPGVYIQEKNAFPDTFVPAPTSVPVFIGYTQFAKSGTTDLTNIPKKISSFAEYEQCFGGDAPMTVTQGATPDQITCTSPFLMHRGMRLFYGNGGDTCYIISVGSYVDKDLNPLLPDKTALIDALHSLVKTPEPTMVVTPDTALMTLAEWGDVAKAVLAHCANQQDRIAILDLVNGTQKFGLPDAIDPVRDFHETVGEIGLDYGTAYYPWVNTSLAELDDITFLQLSDDFKKSLQKDVLAEAKDQTPHNAMLEELANYITNVRSLPRAKSAHTALIQASTTYKDTMKKVLAAVNVMPPSTAMAGIINFTDTTVGPWNAPVDTSINFVLSPTVDMTSGEQQTLNTPLNGKAVNAIRSFMDRGVLVWGARTLDGNSQNWRYISVRRMVILVKRWVRTACEPFVFAANDAQTWTTLKAIIENFLTSLWKLGAFSGGTAKEAFSVEVGLGSTMTSDDIQNGYLKITVLLANTHPAEFITLTFTQEMQKP
ncbi:hypothetical protein L0664_13405 [Octadecabacter sp. G9-8]|uniref:Tail sheath protein C-terminal domain-containing protein n=1 Tax=Octadecabacter dasysiphoniae TaxID=2909341 RepID=A0ABS9CYT5_9RHOB|nr:phage tail sheath C-terminal domain-containing protein [Octadecabacter dasysiphoniae]MCF2872066.1 hypothetical protein [Octadecabacter dasysiphoniae]